MANDQGAVKHTGERSQELLCLCGDCHSVGWFASIGGVLAVLETCISSVFAVIVGSAVGIGVASLLHTAAFCAHATALGIAALFANLQQFLGLSQCYEVCSKFVYCSGAVGSEADLAIAGVS